MLLWISTYEHLHANIAVGRAPRKRVASGDFTIPILLNCPQRASSDLATYGWSPRSLLSEEAIWRRTTGMSMEEGTKNVFCHPLTHPQSIVGAILGALGCGVRWRWEHSGAFLGRDICQNRAYFWQLGDRPPAFPGGSWLPSTLTHLCEQFSCSLHPSISPTTYFESS